MKTIRQGLAVMMVALCSSSAFAQDAPPPAPKPPARAWRSPSPGVSKKAPAKPAPLTCTVNAVGQEWCWRMKRDGALAAEAPTKRSAQESDAPERAAGMFDKLRIEERATEDARAERQRLDERIANQDEWKRQRQRFVDERQRLDERIAAEHSQMDRLSQAQRQLESAQQRLEKIAAEAQAGGVDSPWLKLDHASIRERILALDDFVRQHPGSSIAAALYEEGQLLRELGGRRLVGSSRIMAPALRDEANSRLGVSSPDAPPGAQADIALGAPGSVAVLPKPPPGPDEVADASFHRHGGGFFRFATGWSWMRGIYNGVVAGVPVAGANASGAMANLEMDLGGTLGHHVVFAASGTLGLSPAWGFDDGTNSSIAAGNPSGDRTTGGGAFMATLGGLMDLYPSAHGGLHMFLQPGYTVLHLGDDSGLMADDWLRGFSLGTGAGFDGWVGAHTQIGLTARVDFAWLHNAAQTEDLHTISPGLQLSVTYN